MIQILQGLIGMAIAIAFVIGWHFLLCWKDYQEAKRWIDDLKLHVEEQRKSRPISRG